MKEENNQNNEMDIFTKGFVKPTSFEQAIEKIEIDDLEEIEDNNYVPDEEPVKNSNSNESQTKVDEVIEDLSDQDEKKNTIQKQKRRRKNIFLIIGILIEVLVISFLVYMTFIKEKYSKTLICTSDQQPSDNYSITMKNIYYFDKNDKVAKTENNVIYIFNDKNNYEDYKNNYVSSNIENYKGIKQTTLFDDKNYAYQNKTIYTYSKLKKNKNVTFKDNIFTVKVDKREEPITIYIESYNDVLSNNDKLGFTCE